MSFDPQLLEKILVCTKCRSHLVRDTDALVCVTPECRMRYAIHHDIPNMLVEEAIAVPLADWGPMMQRAGRDPATGTRSAS
jgi:uncharacterized protein YbaR (Trm112 family)